MNSMDRSKLGSTPGIEREFGRTIHQAQGDIKVLVGGGTSMKSTVWWIISWILVCPEMASRHTETTRTVRQTQKKYQKQYSNGSDSVIEAKMDPGASRSGCENNEDNSRSSTPLKNLYQVEFFYRRYRFGSILNWSIRVPKCHQDGWLQRKCHQSKKGYIKSNLSKKATLRSNIGWIRACERAMTRERMTTHMAPYFNSFNFESVNSLQQPFDASFERSGRISEYLYVGGT